jgi:hypothetical protein
MRASVFRAHSSRGAVAGKGTTVLDVRGPYEVRTETQWVLVALVPPFVSSFWGTARTAASGQRCRSNNRSSPGLEAPVRSGTQRPEERGQQPAQRPAGPVPSRAATPLRGRGGGRRLRHGCPWRLRGAKASWSATRPPYAGHAGPCNTAGQRPFEATEHATGPASTKRRPARSPRQASAGAEPLRSDHEGSRGGRAAVPASAGMGTPRVRPLGVRSRVFGEAWGSSGATFPTRPQRTPCWRRRWMNWVSRGSVLAEGCAGWGTGAARLAQVP